MKTRVASHDRHDGAAKRVCACCHRLPKFCTCKLGAVPTCPICKRPLSAGPHFPTLDCKAAS